MIRISPVRAESATAEQQAVLKTVETAMGGVPNLLGTMAQSPAVAKAYLAFSQALAAGQLKSSLREQLALAVGQANDCGYCLSAHTMLGARAGLSAEEIVAARRGQHEDRKVAAALGFAQKVVRERGQVVDEDVAALRRAGLSEAEIVEILGHVGLNLFTNTFNHVAGTVIDFPIAPELD